MDTERDRQPQADPAEDEPRGTRADVEEVRAEEEPEATDPHHLRSMPPTPHGIDDDPASFVDP